MMTLEIPDESAETTPNPADPDGSRLFAEEPGAFGMMATESRAIRTLEQLHAARAFTPAQELLAETARALARNIDRGNLKGRAIGNEAMQLAAVLAQLVDVDTDPDAGAVSNLPPAAAALLEALGTRPPAPSSS